MDGKFKATAISDVWESGTNLEVFNPFLEHLVQMVKFRLILIIHRD